MKPLLSIVIPTKNRYLYLESFVRSFIAFESNEIELVIQDNSDIQSKDFIDNLTSINDQRIKYNYSDISLSMTGNCDLSVDLATGEYVCMLGDDDGLLFDVSIKVIKYCISNSYDAAIVNKAEYYWPDTSHAVWKDLLAGKVFYKKYDFRANSISIENEIAKVLNEGTAWSLGFLPRVYHGFVKKECLNELKSISGTHFPGPSPDMANAIGLAKVVKTLVNIDVPAVISGHSKKSGGGMGGEKKHHGKIEDQPFLPKETVKSWSNKIPKFWSGATIYAASALEALERTDNSQNNPLNYTYLWAFCIVFERKYIKNVMPIVWENPLKIPLLLVYIFRLTSFRGLNYIKNYFKFNSKSNLSLKAKDIFEAQNLLDAILGDNMVFVDNKKA